MEGENVNTEKDASEQRKNSVNLHFLYVKLHISFEMKKKIKARYFSYAYQDQI